MNKITPFELDRLATTFHSLDNHLAVASILAGHTKGHAWADSRSHPQTSILRHGQRFYLAGSPDRKNFNRWLHDFFYEEVYPQSLAAGAAVFILYYDTPTWENVLDEIFAEKKPFKFSRQYYETAATKSDWRSYLPDGFHLRLVERALLEDHTISGLAELHEEMLSERDSVDEFLEKSFGLAPIYVNSLAGWCLSEYNLGDRCEIGIAALPPYQRRGLARALTLAFLELAGERGYQRIGWHCYANNTASVATAHKVGLTKICDYSVYQAWLDPQTNAAMHEQLDR